MSGTNPPAPRPRWLRRGRFDLVEVADVIVALICFGVANAWLTTQNAHHHAGYGSGALLLVAFVTSAPLVLRTRLPVIAWLTSGLAILGANLLVPVGSLASTRYTPPSLLVYGLCLYAVTVRAKPPIATGAVLGTLVLVAVTNWGSFPAAVFLTAIPVLIGIIVRTRRSGQQQLAEQERRHLGERTLLEERQRIARELHDVVAHHMSVIAIQAEAAPYKTADPPPELVESFGEIRASALTGLGELRRLLGVLRTGGPDTAPQPGLADLDALIDSARSGGVSVTATSSGAPVTLPDGVDLSAYRILQEALSNAMRHAPGSHVDVHVSYVPDGLTLRVRNDAVSQNGAGPGCGGSGAGGGGGGGHGLIGMRERTAMLGGSLRAEPTADGGFQVIAVLPARQDQQGDAA